MPEAISSTRIPSEAKRFLAGSVFLLFDIPKRSFVVLSNIVRSFSIGHPFWDQAVRLRQDHHTIYQILEAAREAGHTELSFNQLAYGLRHAPADLYLPTRTTIKLREKFGDVSARFNAYTAMLDLTQEAQIKMEEIEEELGNPETTPSRRQFLESQHYRWFGRAFDYSTVCTELAIQMKVAGVLLGEQEPKDEEDIVDGEVIDHDQKLIEEFAAKVPTFAPEAVVTDYGHDNVRPPEEDDGSDDEDEESESGD